MNEDICKDNGEILWQNPLTGFGYGYCIIASKDSNAEVVVSSEETAAAV